MVSKQWGPIIDCLFGEPRCLLWRVAVPRRRHQRQNETQQAEGQRDRLDL